MTFGPESGRRVMPADMSSVNDLLDLIGEKMCTHDGCRHDKFHYLPTFGPTYRGM